VSLSAAHEKVRTAQALRGLPEISAAFAQGRLSYTKVRALTRVAAKHDADALLEYALRSTAPQVEERCRQLRNGETDSVAIARRAWEHRSLALWRDTARNVMAIRVEVPLEEGELVARAIEKAVAVGDVADGIEFLNDPSDDRERGSSTAWCAQQADALIAVVKAYLADDAPASEDARSGADAEVASGTSADRYQVVLHVEDSALRGGRGRSDLPIDTVKRLTCDGSVVTVIEDAHGSPLDVGRKQRTVSTPLKRALWARDRGCSFPGCQRTRYVDAHHIRHWIEGGPTSLDNLTLLCTYHHRLLHEGRFTTGRDEIGRLFFRRADGRVIPLSGYSWADMRDDCVPSTEGLRVHGDFRSEVREARASYTVSPRFGSTWCSQLPQNRSRADTTYRQVPPTSTASKGQHVTSAT
jgi:hypothetical protein